MHHDRIDSKSLTLKGTPNRLIAQLLPKNVLYSSGPSSIHRTPQQLGKCHLPGSIYYYDILGLMAFHAPALQRA